MTVEPTVPLVGRDKAVEGEIAVSQQQGRPVSPLPCSRTGKGSSYQESKDQLRGSLDQKKGERMPSRGSTFPLLSLNRQGAPFVRISWQLRLHSFERSGSWNV